MRHSLLMSSGSAAAGGRERVQPAPGPAVAGRSPRRRMDAKSGTSNRPMGLAVGATSAHQSAEQSAKARREDADARACVDPEAGVEDRPVAVEDALEELVALEGGNPAGLLLRLDRHHVQLGLDALQPVRDASEVARARRQRLTVLAVISRRAQAPATRAAGSPRRSGLPMSVDSSAASARMSSSAVAEGSPAAARPAPDCCSSFDMRSAVSARNCCDRALGPGRPGPGRRQVPSERRHSSAEQRGKANLAALPCSDQPALLDRRRDEGRNSGCGSKGFDFSSG